MKLHDMSNARMPRCLQSQQAASVIEHAKERELEPVWHTPAKAGLCNGCVEGCCKCCCHDRDQVLSCVSGISGVFQSDLVLASLRLHQ